MVTHQFESSGKLKLPSAEAIASADRDTAIVCYTNGTLNDGRFYYAYVAVKPGKYLEFHELTSARKSIVLGEFGEILAAGFEPSPPDGVVKRMREEYGYDEQFAQRLKDEVVKQRGSFSKAQEEKRLMDIVAMLRAQKPAG